MSAYDDTEPLTESETRCQKRHHPRIQPPPQASVMQDEENRFRTGVAALTATRHLARLSMTGRKKGLQHGQERRLRSPKKESVL